MKQLRLVSAALLLVMFMVGCKTAPTDTQKIAFAAALAKSAVVMGVGYDLQANPEHRVAYEVAEQSLNMLLKNGNYDAAKLAAALQSLPVKELKGTQGALIISGAVSVFELATSTFFDPSSSQAVFAVGTAVRDGLATALATTPTVTATLMRVGPPSGPTYKIPSAVHKKI